MKRRILAILLAAIMVLSAMPFSVFATEGEAEEILCPGKGEIHTADNCKSEWFADVAPVCNKPGYSVYTCLGCGDQYIVITKEASNTPHTLVSATKAPDCYNAGIKENVWQCTACKSYFKDADAKEEYTDKSYVAPKLDHKLKGVSQFETLADDCTKEKCKLCGKVQTKSSHKYHEWKLVEFVEAPTCKDTSTAKYVCAIEGCTGNRVVTVEASKYMHTLTHVKASTAPACSTNGNIEYYSCSVCGKNYATKDANVEDALESVKIDHVKGALQARVPGTCTKEGVDTYQCTVCFENFDVSTGLDVDYIYNIKDAYGNLLKDADGNVIEFVKARHIAETITLPGGGTVVVYDKRDDHLQTVPAGTADENLVVVGIYHQFNPKADQYTEETCTTYGYVQRLCVKCGYIHNEQVKEPTGHVIDENAGYTVTDKPGCITAGTAEYTCAKCDQKVIASIPATGHDVKVAAGSAYGANAVTCVKDGWYFEYCANGADCDGYGYTWEPKVTIQLAPGAAVEVVLRGYAVKDGSFKSDAKADKSVENGFHDWVEATDSDKRPIINEATCTTDGSKVKYCTLCSAHKTEVIPATGHKYVLSWDASIALEDRTLENSDQFKDANAVIVAANCTDAGYLKLVCANGCKNADGSDHYSNAADFGTDGETTVSLKTEDAKGHDDYVKTVLPHCVDLNNDTTKKYDKDNKWDDRKGYTVTYCPTCDKELSARTATGATYSLALEYSIDDAKVVHNLGTKTEYINGNCTVKGLDKYYCNDCHVNILVVQPGTGSHVQPAGLAITAPTCFAPGSTPAYKCQRCEIDVPAAPIPQLTHNFTKVFNGTSATCTVKGIKAIYTCSQDCCDKTFFVDVTYNKDTGALTGWKKLDWAANTEDESKTLENAKKLAQTIDCVEHVVGTVKNKVNPDCTNTGVKRYVVCKNCKQNFVSDLLKKDNKFFGTAAEAEDLVIPANGHSYADFPGNTEKDCTKPVYLYQECTVCDYGHVVDYKAPINHNWKPVKDKQGVKATCTVVGGDYYKCANCGKEEIRNRVEMLDHVNKDGLAIGHGDKTITCTVGLKDDQRKCATKGCTFVATKDFHIVKTTNVPATCTTDGYTVVTCSVCEEVLEDVTIVKHSMEKHIKDRTVTEITEKYVAPTETTSGQKVWKCDDCGYTYTEVINPTATVYLDLTYANANGQEGFAESSIITVKVLLSSKKAAIRTLSYGVDYDESKLKFINATFDNTFSIASINDANGVVKFAGMSANPVEVGEAVAVATITFQAIAAGEAKFEFDDEEAYLEAGAAVTVNDVIDDAETTEVDESKITIVKLMNVYTKDQTAGTIDMQDALAIYDLMTSGKYNVAADLDKDGTVGSNDLQLFYDYFVGAKTLKDIFDYVV